MTTKMTYSLKASGRFRAISAQISSTTSRATWREGRVRLGPLSRYQSSQLAQALGGQAQSSSCLCRDPECPLRTENRLHAGEEHCFWSLRDSGFKFFLSSMTLHLSEASLRHKSCPDRDSAPLGAHPRGWCVPTPPAPACQKHSLTYGARFDFEMAFKASGEKKELPLRTAARLGQREGRQ